MSSGQPKLAGRRGAGGGSEGHLTQRLVDREERAVDQHKGDGPGQTPHNPGAAASHKSTKYFSQTRGHGCMVNKDSWLVLICRRPMAVEECIARLGSALELEVPFRLSLSRFPFDYLGNFEGIVLVEGP